MDHELNLDADGATLTAALTDIASVSGEEKPLADAIERALAPLPHLTVDRFGNTLVARTSLGHQERVVLAGHIDTVPLAGNVPSSFNPERTRLTGCGTSDMKSGVAVQLRLAAGLTGTRSRPNAPSRDVTYVFYECEEVDVARNGLFKLSRSAPELLAGDFAVLLEPSGGAVEGGCQGTLRAAVTASGVRAHTARSWMGRNAIHEAAEILEVLRSWEARTPVVDGLEYHEGLNAVAISGGVAGNVVPDSCTVTVNYRFAPDRSGSGGGGVHPVPVFGVGGVAARRGRRRQAGAVVPRGRGLRRRGGRHAARQARLDGRGQVRRARHPRGQLRSGYPGPRAHPWRVRRGGRYRRVRVPAPRLAGRVNPPLPRPSRAWARKTAERPETAEPYFAISDRVTLVWCLVPLAST